MKVCSVCLHCFDDAAFNCVNDDADLSHIRPGRPEMISGYQLERLVDQHNKVETYLSYHLKSERQCLIKVFATDGDRRAQFLRDAEVAASLFNPNVIDVFESGTLETGELYLVTEKPTGRSLRDFLTESGSIDMLTAVNIIRQAAEAVHGLHLKGLLHRAIRPENIFISDDVVRIQNPDFGGMLEHATVSDKFTIDSAIEVLRYYAPEQFAGETVSIKTDVYSLGIVFYEMLAGHPPFEASNAAGLIEMHRNARPADVQIADFDLRMLITHTLMESLNKHPENRHSSANAFARQLRHVEQLATHVSTPPPAGNVPPWPVRSVDVLADAEFARNAEIASVYEQPKPIMIEPSVDVAAAQIARFEQDPNLEPSPTVKLATTEYQNPAVSSTHVEAVAQHGAFPTASRLTRLRRRFKKHRPELTAVSHEKVPIENSIREVSSDPFAHVPTEQRPKNVAWQTPDDDVPSIEDVILAREDVSLPVEKVFASAGPAIQEAEVEPPIRNVSVEQTEDADAAAPVENELDIPAEVSRPIAVINNSKPIIITNPRKLGLRDEAAAQRASTTHHEPDEITAVTARIRPIRIPVQRARSQRSHAMARAALPNSSVDGFFFPTLLGGSTALASDERESMFSGFYGDSVGRSPVVSRVIKVSGAVLAIASIFMIGRQLSGELRSEAAPVVTNSTQVVSQPVISDMSQTAISATTKQPQRISDKPSTDSVTVNEKSVGDSKATQSSVDSVSRKTRSEFSEDKSGPMSEVSRVKLTRESSSRPTKANTGVSKTTSKRNDDKPISQNKPGATMRPRIVANPRP